MTLDEMRLVNGDIAHGQSDPEYATVILKLCGIKEEWKQEGTPPRQVWVSSVAQLRKNLQELVRLIKVRTAKNVQDHAEARRAIGMVQRFIESHQ